MTTAIDALFESVDFSITDELARHEREEQQQSLLAKSAETGATEALAIEDEDARAAVLRAVRVRAAGARDAALDAAEARNALRAEVERVTAAAAAAEAEARLAVAARDARRDQLSAARRGRDEALGSRYAAQAALDRAEVDAAASAEAHKREIEVLRADLARLETELRALDEETRALEDAFAVVAVDKATALERREENRERLAGLRIETAAMRDELARRSRRRSWGTPGALISRVRSAFSPDSPATSATSTPATSPGAEEAVVVVDAEPGSAPAETTSPVDAVRKAWKDEDSEEVINAAALRLHRASAAFTPANVDAAGVRETASPIDEASVAAGSSAAWVKETDDDAPRSPSPGHGPHIV